MESVPDPLYFIIFAEIKPKDGEEFELLDYVDRGWLEKMFGDLTKASVAKQIAVGGASGW